MGALHKGDLGTIKTMCFVLRRGKVTNEDHDLFSILRAVLFFLFVPQRFFCAVFYRTINWLNALEGILIGRCVAYLNFNPI